MRKTILGLFLLVLLSGCASQGADQAVSVALTDIPEFSGEPYVVIEDNDPDFPESDYTSEGFEEYSPLDALGRCGVAYANVGLETMPTEERGSISSVKPTGWQSVQYDFVDGKSLYNRCHLIGFQLTGENANRENLITGTRYMNVDGMLPFENEVAAYVEQTGNHVLYRVTPVFEGDNLVASGVLMEAESVEDQGEGVQFEVYVYNEQPGVEIDYATGDSWPEGEQGASAQDASYILNSSSKKFHKPDCTSVETISPSNKQTYRGSRQELVGQGYAPCGKCKP